MCLTCVSKLESYDTVPKGLFYGVFGVSKVVSKPIVTSLKIFDTNLEYE